MDELSDRWVLPAAEFNVKRCCIDDALTIDFSHGDASEAMLFVSGPFELQTSGGSVLLRPAGDAASMAPVLSLLGLSVDRAEALKVGTLEVAFGDGSRLRIPPDERFEAWEFIGLHGAKAIALPGGNVAIWRPAA